MRRFDIAELERRETRAHVIENFVALSLPGYHRIVFFRAIGLVGQILIDHHLIGLQINLVLLRPGARRDDGTDAQHQYAKRQIFSVHIILSNLHG